MDPLPDTRSKGFILRLEDDPQRRGFESDKAPNRTYLYLANPETNEWDYEEENAYVFPTVHQLVTAACNSHAQSKIHSSEKLDIFDTELERVRPILHSELKGGTKCKILRPVPDEC